jgi:uncharacterized protein
MAKSSKKKDGNKKAADTVKSAGTSSFKAPAPAREVKIERSVPRGYGETKIVLMPRDPFWAYAYWEITEETFGAVRSKYGKDAIDKSKLVLRVYDVTGIKFNGSNANRYFDIALIPFAENWYINVPEADRSLCVDLGLLLPDGRFITLIRSNVISMPRQSISQITDEQWGILQKEFERILKLSGIEQLGRTSFELAKLLRERWTQFMLMNMPSSPSSSLGSSAFRVPVEEKEEGKGRGFWLQANTELILYGSTESDAKLTVAGESVKLNGDGSFSLRFSLADGVKDLPVKASSADNKLFKTIRFKVSRKTE